MKYFDTHAHYQDERFSEECAGGARALLDKLFSENVSYIVNVATSPDSAREVIEQARNYPNMYTAIGIHPSDATYLDMDVQQAVGIIRELAKNPESKCVAIGEIGLDYHYPDTNKTLQHEYFEAQLSLARELDLPVIIHDRDAHQDTLDILKRYPDVRGVLHSYSGSAEMARELIALGYMISFSGVLTFTNAKKAREVAASIPPERIMIETDCPYLSPHPHRGELNHSGRLEFTNRTLAEILGLTEERAAVLTEENARRFFGI